MDQLQHKQDISIHPEYSVKSQPYWHSLPSLLPFIQASFIDGCIPIWKMMEPLLSIARLSSPSRSCFLSWRACLSSQTSTCTLTGCYSLLKLAMAGLPFSRLAEANCIYFQSIEFDNVPCLGIAFQCFGSAFSPFLLFVLIHFTDGMVY